LTLRVVPAMMIGTRSARSAAKANRKRLEQREDMVKLLLTSGGIKNPSIRDALVELLGKPIAEANALCITTASYGHPMAGPAAAWSFHQRPR
jgi:hypothetical protein